MPGVLTSRSTPAAPLGSPRSTPCKGLAECVREGRGVPYETMAILRRFEYEHSSSLAERLSDVRGQNARRGDEHQRSARAKVGRCAVPTVDEPSRQTGRIGCDNTTFRLGEDMSVRLPSAEQYALQGHPRRRDRCRRPGVPYGKRPSRRYGTAHLSGSTGTSLGETSWSKTTG